MRRGKHNSPTPLPIFLMLYSDVFKCHGALDTDGDGSPRGGCRGRVEDHTNSASCVDFLARPSTLLANLHPEADPERPGLCHRWFSDNKETARAC